MFKKVVERMIDFFSHRGVAIVTVSHDVDMNVAVTSMTKAGDGKSMPGLQRFCEFQ